MWNAGLPNGRESYGNGVLIVVRVMENMIQGEGEQVRYFMSEKKESVMLEASKYLEIVRKRAVKSQGLERVYRLIRKKDILLQAYINLYSNEGANTPGIDSDDVIDGMSLKKKSKHYLKN